MGLVSLTLVTCAALVWVACPAEPPEPPRGLLLFLTLDTTRADHLGAYGYFRDTSPSIDALAADAILFERAVTSMATTLPAHVSLFTGTYPSTHGVESNFENSGVAFAAAGGLRSLAEILQEQGWPTAAIVSAAPLKRHSGIQAGFRDYLEPEGREIRAEVVTDRALRWLDENPGLPALLWLHYFDPHHPYDPPKGTPGFDSGGEQQSFLARTLGREGAPRIRRMNDAYDGEIRYLDAQVGRLLDALRERGLYEDATIVLVGDHGEGLGQHGRDFHGTIHNEQLFVPLLVKLPASLGRRGERNDELVSIVDVLPTVAAALQIPLGDDSLLDGASRLEGARRTGALAARTAWQRSGWDPGRNFAWVTDEWKYLHRTDARDALFDLRGDPHELRNVIEEEPEIASKLRASLFEALEASQAKRAAATTTAEIPEDVVEELRALGYGR